MVFLFQYYNLTGTESLCNSKAGTETSDGWMGGQGFECFCLNIGRKIYIPQSHFPSAMNTTFEAVFNSQPRAISAQGCALLD